MALSPTCPGGPCSPGGPCNPVSPCGPGSPFCSGGQSLSTQKSGFAKEKNQSSYGPLNLENEHKSFHLSQEHTYNLDFLKFKMRLKNSVNLSQGYAY